MKPVRVCLSANLAKCDKGSPSIKGGNIGSVSNSACNRPKTHASTNEGMCQEEKLQDCGLDLDIWEWEKQKRTQREKNSNAQEDRKMSVWIS